jgi:hypothetical protein
VTFADKLRKIDVGRVPTISETVKDPSIRASELVSIATDKYVVPIGPPRASSLQDACMRMHVLGVKYEKTRTEWGDFQSKLMFGIGNSLHYWIQNTGDVLGNNRLGWWHCLACGKDRPNFGPPPTIKCPHCNARPEASIYREHHVDPFGDYPVSGSPDMFIQAKKALFRVLELKSMNGEDFEKLKAPLAPHEWQVRTYSWKCSKDKKLPVKIDSSAGYVLYISKKNFKNQFPMKLFIVHEDKSVLKIIKEKVALYRDGIEHFPEKIPSRAIACGKSGLTCYQAKQCPVLKECFDHGPKLDAKMQLKA